MTTGVLITNEQGLYLTTDKHGAFTWTVDPDQAIHLCRQADAALLSRANAGLQQIQANRGTAEHEPDDGPASAARAKAQARAVEILSALTTDRSSEALVEELRELDRTFYGRRAT